ncbi:MAG TPA: hypothetical protein VNW52_12630 [Burkholderiaceae bacterium]|jgi:hypothetical protein|nr:hypothetical protein [Burkholderiaceae bacterium]
MNKHEVIARLRRDLHAAMVERQLAATDATTAKARAALRSFQSARMAVTHADLLASDETRDAAQFFLDDLYGTHDFTQRDADIERIIPMMESLMPVSALQTIAEAIELDALSEALDRAMAVSLGEQFIEADYIAAYRKVASRTERESQIAHIQSVGRSLCELVRIPLIGGTLAMMRVPAMLAGLHELHSFLNRGFGAFKKMRKPKDFVATIVMRETAILDNMYAQKPQPFDLG